MKIPTYISRMVSRFLPFIAGALLWGCAADDFNLSETPFETSGDTQLTINLAIPHGEKVTLATRAVAGDGPSVGDPSQGAEVDELGISNLRLYMFPADGGDVIAEDIVNKSLTPLPGLSNTKTSETYNISGLKIGANYQLYLLANFGSDVAAFTSASDLEIKVIDYTSTAHNLVPGNLPMVYKHPSLITVTTDGSQTIDAALKYACAKIRFNIIFDKSDEKTAAAFGSKNLEPGTISLSNVTKEAKVMWDRATSLYGTANATTKTLGYSLYNNWTKALSAPTDGSDMITGISESNKITVAQAAAADKWIMRATAYVPERHVTTQNNQTTLKLASKIGGSDVEHGTPVGLKSEQYKNIERGSYYEYVGTIHNTNLDDMDWECTVHPWIDETINADFVHTFLTLSSTTTHITSFENGEISYETDGRGALGFESPTVEVDGEQLELFEIQPAGASTEKKLVIRVNSNIPITVLQETGMTSNSVGVPCYITAGNIRKQIMVTYDIQPFLEITPVSMKIQDGDGTTEDQHYFSYRTNLGGFTMTSLNVNAWTFSKTTTTQTAAKTHTVGGSYFTVSVSGSAASGTIRITAAHPATTTVMHTFNVKDATSVSTGTEIVEPIVLSVEVMPKKTNYRVYFRAINDYQGGDGEEFLNFSEGKLPPEVYTTGNNNTNWVDYWTWNGTTRHVTTIQSGQHRLYAYTQVGDAANVNPVWKYTSNFGSADAFTYINSDTGVTIKSQNPNMTGDSNNPGWYYYDLPVRCKADFDDKEQTVSQDIQDKYGNGPLPGATLLIFYSGDDRHRVNYNDEAGIPLGDYNDYESWVLFDPSRDPIYNVYDDKPIIEDVQYIIYSDVPMSEWRSEFGTDGSTGVHNIHRSMSIDTSLPNESGYAYKYSIYLKAPRGEYDKNINLAVTSGATGTPPPSQSGVSNYRLYFGVPEGYETTWSNPQIKIMGNDSEWGGGTLTKSEKCGNIQYYYYEFTSTYEKDDAQNKGVRIYSGSTSHPASGHVQIHPWSGKQEEIIVGTWTLQELGTALDYNPGTTKYIPMYGNHSWRKGYYKNGSWRQTR